MTVDQPSGGCTDGDHTCFRRVRNGVMSSTPPVRPQNRIDREGVDIGPDDRQLAALIRIAEALERLADGLESNHRGGRGVFDAGPGL